MIVFLFLPYVALERYSKLINLYLLIVIYKKKYRKYKVKSIKGEWTFTKKKIKLGNTKTNTERDPGTWREMNRQSSKGQKGTDKICTNKSD